MTRRSAAANERFERSGTLVVKSDRGEVNVNTSGYAAITVIRGHLDEKLAERLRDALRDGTRGGRCKVAFHDWEAMTGYDPAARQLLAKVLEEGRAHFGTAHILLGASLAGMGISVAAALLGRGVRSHTSDGGGCF